MKETGLDQNNLDTAIALGDAVCNELGICCDKRGRVIFQIYKKLEEVRPQKLSPEETETDAVQAELSAHSIIAEQNN